ncbi:MAG: radical SAM protein [Patescibacteria group bacterium]|nr:radical SAM protein [Patescibacteria group bacterium]MCL5261985.1 radical SAM protein [Patescibacteria group bacterium]
MLCSLRPQAKLNKDKNTRDILKLIDEGRRSGYARVEFTGGEPTIRPDIFALIAAAKKSGFTEIAMSTNGRMFGYERFLNKAADAGLNRITLTLYGPNAKTHNAIARTPDSFKQTVAGIKNILARKDVTLSVNTVVCRLNCGYLLETGEFLSNLGVRVWGLLDLIPFGNAEQFYDKLAVDIKTLSLNIRRLAGIIDRFDQVEFFDFPVCVLGKRLIKDQHITVFDAQGRVDEFKQVGYNPQRFSNKGDLYEDIHKTRLGVCADCSMKKRCAGIWKPYPQIFGLAAVEKDIGSCIADLLGSEK